MILKKFSVKNYKNFSEEVVIDFSDVKNYNFNQNCIKDNFIKNVIVYGKNAVGKTNFSQAFMDITYHLVDKQKDAKAYMDYINADASEKIAFFEYVFEENGNIITYKYQKKNPDILVCEALYLNKQEIFLCDYTKNILRKDNLETIGKISLNWLFRDNNISILRYIANNTNLDDNNVIMKLMKFVNGMLWFSSLGNGNNYVGLKIGNELITDFIIKNDYVAELEEFFRWCGVNEELIVLTESTGNKGLYFKHNVPIPIVVASSGTNALLALFYWKKHEHYISFLIIDEFDAFFHFELAEKIVKFLTDYSQVQVVLTSHNTNLVSNSIMRPDCYFILTNNKLTSFCNATYRELREGHNLEKLYMGGEFGG